jgi:hypothetical protein
MMLMLSDVDAEQQPTSNRLLSPFYLHFGPFLGWQTVANGGKWEVAPVQLAQQVEA